MGYPPLDDICRAEARNLYESTNLSIQRIGEKLGVSHSIIARMAKNGAWRRPFRPGEFRSGARPGGQPINLKQQFLDRLWSATARELSEIEVSLASASRSPAARDEDRKGLVTLTKLAREMQAFERDLRPETEDDEEALPRDLDALRDSLATRIEQLRAERLQREAAEGKPEMGPWGPNSNPTGPNHL